MLTNDDRKEHHQLVAPLIHRRMLEKREWAQEAVNMVLWGTLCGRSADPCSFCTGVPTNSEARALGARKLMTMVLESEHEAGVSVDELVRTWSVEDLAARIIHHPDAHVVLELLQDEVDARIYLRATMAADKFARWQRGEVQY